MNSNHKIYFACASLLALLVGCALELPKPPLRMRPKAQQAVPMEFTELLLLERSWLQTLYLTKTLVGAAVFSETLIERLDVHPAKNCIQMVKFDSGELVGDFVPLPCKKELFDAKEIAFSLQPMGLNGRDFVLTLGDLDRGFGVAERDPISGVVTLVDLCETNCQLLIEKGRIISIEFLF